MSTTMTRTARAALTPVCVLALLATGLDLPCRADTIYFKSGTTLKCKVVGDTPEGLLVLLGNDDTASMVLDRSTIRKIDYDYDSRLQALRQREKQEGHLLYGEHYRLGVWCEERGMEDAAMFARALDRYLYCKGKPGVPAEVFLRMGRMYERAAPPNFAEAYSAYAQYRKLRPDSVETAKAMERLGKELAKQQPVPKPGPAPATPAGEGLETSTWSWERWSNPGTARPVKDTGNGRTTVLELKFRNAGKDKFAVIHRINGNLAKKKAILLDVYNPGKHPVSIALALVTGGDYQWFESKTRTAAPGAWTMGNAGMRFDLTMKTWKSKASGWRNVVRPGKLDQTRNLLILVYNRGATGTIYVDNIRMQQ